jgi:hypothetical protein
VDIELVLGDVAYDSEKVRQTAEQTGILFLTPIDRRNSVERKDAYGCVFSVFLKTRFVQWLFGLCREIERVFNELKSDGVEQPRWYDFIDMYCMCYAASLCIISSFVTPSSYVKWNYYNYSLIQILIVVKMTSESCMLL